MVFLDIPFHVLFDHGCIYTLLQKAFMLNAQIFK